MKLAVDAKWAFFKTLNIGRRESETGEWTTYMRRFIILRTPWFQLMLHKFLRPDQDPDLHDHPWNFRTWVLKGGYKEMTPAGENVLHEGQLAFRPAEHFHRITVLLRVPTWTLVLTGKKRKSWGFRTEQGFIPWRQYLVMHGQMPDTPYVED